MSFVIAFCMIGLGIAQRTVFAEPDSTTASTILSTDATVTLIDNKTLHSLDGRQTIDISGSSKIFAAYGRTEDVIAWIGKAGYNRLAYNETSHRLTNRLVSGGETQVPDPAGSDLWLGEFNRVSSLNFTVNVPDDISIMVVSDGKKPAPSRVSISWPLDNRTPFSGPLIVGGLVLLLVGLGLYLWVSLTSASCVVRAEGLRRCRRSLVSAATRCGSPALLLPSPAVEPLPVV